MSDVTPRSGLSEPRGGINSNQFANLPVSWLVGAGALALVSFANLISLYDGDADTTTTLDLQSLLKLGFVGSLGLYSVQRMWAEPGMFRLMLGVPGGFLSGIAVWLLFTSLLSSSPAVSLASALASTACIWGAMGGVLQLGPERVLRICFWACLAFLAGSWALWILDREAATFLEPIDNGEFVARFGGLSHPNAIGQFSGLVIVLCCLLLGPRISSSRDKLVFWIGLLLGCMSLLACASRTSILATGLSLAFAWRSELFRGRALIAMFGIGTLVLAGLLVFSLEPSTSRKLSDRLLNVISKSGTTEELASGTGRSLIWAESIRLIAERPLTGYGPATSKDLLADFTRYTHNMLLNVGLSGGVLPMLLLGLAFAYGFGQILTAPQVLPDSLFLFLFLNGLAENVCFLVLDSAPMVILTTVLVWRKVDTGLSTKRPTDLDNLNSVGALP